MSPYATAVTFVMLRRAGHPGVQLAQVHLARVRIGEEVELEVPAVALRAQALAHRERPLAARAARCCSVSTSGKTSLPHQPPSYGRELREPGQLRHQRARPSVP